MWTVTFIRHDPDQRVQEKELNIARARAHAARVFHSRRQRNTKRQRKPAVPRRQEADPKSKEIIEQPPLPLAARFEGNSDPFQCYAIEITPELNRVLAFTRDVVLQAHYAPLAIRRMSQALSVDLVQPSISRAWAEISASLQDEGTALARLTTYCQYLSNLVANPTGMRVLGFQMRKRSLRLMREKLERYTSSSPEPVKRGLKQHIFALFNAECFCGDTEAAIVHARALQKLSYEGNTLDTSMALRLLYIICHTAGKTGKRTLSSVSEWIIHTFEALLGTRLPPHPFGHRKKHVLHATVTLGDLHDLFTRCWYLTDAITTRRPQARNCSRVKPAPAPAPAPGALENTEAAYLYMSVSSLIIMTRLNNMYHDLVDAVRMPDASTCERYTQAALCAALNYMMRRMFGDLTIRGVNMRDRSSIQMAQLQAAFTKAYQCSSLSERRDFAAAYLWILSVGALCEQHRGGGGGGGGGDVFAAVDSSDKAWFSTLLLFQAESMGVANWSQIRIIAEQFFYAGIVEPDGVVWFEALRQRYTGASRRMKTSLADRFAWFFSVTDTT